MRGHQSPHPEFRVDSPVSYLTIMPSFMSVAIHHPLPSSLHFQFRTYLFFFFFLLLFLTFFQSRVAQSIFNFVLVLKHLEGFLEKSLKVSFSAKSQILNQFVSVLSLTQFRCKLYSLVISRFLVNPIYILHFMIFTQCYWCC